jgi:CheY-like chemotaxis protein
MAKVQLFLKDQIIVILDDNELTRKSLKHLFEDQGAVVHTTGHLEKGISVIEGMVSHGDSPDLIISDITLPGCFGLQVLQFLKESLNGIRVPIIVNSRGFNKLAVRRMMMFGVVGYVEKPVLIERLFEFSLSLLSECKKRNLSNSKPDKNAA